MGNYSRMMFLDINIPKRVSDIVAKIQYENFSNCKCSWFNGDNLTCQRFLYFRSIEIFI